MKSGHSNPEQKQTKFSRFRAKKIKMGLLNYRWLDNAIKGLLAQSE
jgi:hypothetical protein